MYTQSVVMAAAKCFHAQQTNRLYCSLVILRPSIHSSTKRKLEATQSGIGKQQDKWASSTQDSDRVVAVDDDERISNET